ncbi:MAG: tyrosine-type recombinase/integrase, partial [Actinomycetota bacterium]
MSSKNRRGHGEGSIYQRQGGLWVGVVNLGRVNGKRQRKTFYGKTRREVAEKLKPALKAQADGVALKTSDRLTVGAYLGEWIDGMRAHVRASTWIRYRQLVNLHVVRHVGHIRLTKLTPSDLSKMY